MRTKDGGGGKVCPERSGHTSQVVPVKMRDRKVVSVFFFKEGSSGNCKVLSTELTVVSLLAFKSHSDFNQTEIPSSNSNKHLHAVQILYSTHFI